VLEHNLADLAFDQLMDKLGVASLHRAPLYQSISLFLTFGHICNGLLTTIPLRGGESDAGSLQTH
jgi:hypothetical protein